MIALFIVINKTELFENLIEEFHKNDIHSGTIFESLGMASIFNHDTMVGNFRGALNKFRPFNKTILMILPEDKAESAKRCVRTVIGDLDREDVGIMFTIPVSSFEGIRGYDA
ncbi:MAG: hypothetical protein Q4P34_05150 [Tissierellia bacterium]|nr:hypothetical protein [Tissierellia bacterium]